MKQRAKNACTRLVAVCALSGTLRSFKLVPAKWHRLSRLPAGNAGRWALE
jgi:hypothetical protein